MSIEHTKGAMEIATVHVLYLLNTEAIFYNMAAYNRNIAVHLHSFQNKLHHSQRCVKVLTFFSFDL